MARKFEEKEIIFATNNPGKVRELKAMFAGKNLDIEVKTSGDFPDLEEPEETEDNFLGNALIKARYTAEATGKVVMADDSGFCVDALEGAPGVYSADWMYNEAGERDAQLAMGKVKDLMAMAENRKANFTTCLVLCWPDGHYETVEGHVYGEVVFPPRGDGGFGYDPIFQPEGYDITFGEMAAEEKNKFSHRANALKKILDKCF